MSEATLTGVGIFVPVSDLKRSTQWYAEVLGFKLIDDATPNAMTFIMNDEKIMFCLVRSFDFQPQPFPKNRYRVEQYYSFHTPDVDGAHRSLKEKGANVGEIVRYGPMRGFAVYDPDGNRYLVVQ